MAAQAGKSVVWSMKNDAGSPAYVVMAGLRTRSMKFDHETIDVTAAESTGLWRELLAGGGVRSATMSGDGVFKDSAAVEVARDAFFDGDIRDNKMLFPGFGTMEGPFQLTALEFGAEYNGAVTFSFTLESSGEVTFTAV
jgi:TP901-1 family phage major tail protein